MKRRHFITLIGGVAAAWPVKARALPAADTVEPRETHRIAVISPASPTSLMTEKSSNLFQREFFTELRRLGYVEGENLVVYRFSSEGNAQRNPQVVMAAIASGPDVIFAFSSRMVKLLKDTTANIPIVGYTADPISFGIVTSLARPGGNVTGISTEAGVEIDEKRLSILKEMVPAASRLAVLTPLGFWMSSYGGAIRMFASRLGFVVVGTPFGHSIDANEIRSTFAEMQRDKADAVLVPDVPENNSYQQLIVELAGRAHLPTITSTRQFVEAGALISYGPDPADLVRRAVSYIDRILRGEKPGDLPVQQPVKFELIINLKTARALGVEVPPKLLSIADEVIE